MGPPGQEAPDMFACDGEHLGVKFTIRAPSFGVIPQALREYADIIESHLPKKEAADDVPGNSGG